MLPVISLFPIYPFSHFITVLWVGFSSLTSISRILFDCLSIFISTTSILFQFKPLSLILSSILGISSSHFLAFLQILHKVISLDFLFCFPTHTFFIFISLLSIYTSAAVLPPLSSFFPLLSLILAFLPPLFIVGKVNFVFIV